jgi:hypothetical protein
MTDFGTTFFEAGTLSVDSRARSLPDERAI